MSDRRPKLMRREAVTRTYPIMIQTASKGLAWMSEVIVGRAIRTMFESSTAMKAPIVVLVRTTYLYCKSWDSHSARNGCE